MPEELQGQNAKRAPAPTPFGVLYPKDDILALANDQTHANAAVQALGEAGIPADDVFVVEGKQLVKFDRSVLDHENIAQRLGRAISYLLSDDALIERHYVDEARKGRLLLIVHAPDHDVVDRVVPVLQAHQVHDARYYGPLSVEDLF